MIRRWLEMKRGQKVRIVVPQKGQKERLIELAERNAAMVLSKDKEELKREELRTTGAMNQIGQMIGLGRLRRIEAYDISNTSGLESVGSMVVYEDGKPKRSDYRKFKIRSVKGPNDYASMKEVLSRRFRPRPGGSQKPGRGRRGSGAGQLTRFPDLILMDGGRGQVNIALEVLKELGLRFRCAAWSRTTIHRTRGLYHNNVEVPMDRHSEAFRLITRIQDEAHRFAIEYHRSLRSKGQVHSVLDEIPDIGPARRKALMRQFQSLEAVKEAGLEDWRRCRG